MRSKKDFFNGMITGACCMGLIAGLFIAVPSIKNRNSAADNIHKVTQSSEFNEKYEAICKNIDTYYLNPNDVKTEDVSNGLFKGMLESIGDKYAAYYSPEDYKDLLETTQGQYAGIGAYVAVNSKTGDIVIVNPFKGAPADKAGVKSGDIIITVAGKSVVGKELSDVTELMKGEAGTDVEVSLIRDGEPIDITITREIVDVPTVTHELIAEYNIGYIYVSSFDEMTSKQFREAIDDIENKGADGLVVDVRNNGGGVLAAVIDMLDRMLPEGLIMYTENKNGRDNEYYSNAEESYDKPYAVLINGYSASASEVFAGAIKDYGYGKIIGTKSYGKGVVQTIFPLNTGDNSAIKVTTSKYFTPNGTNIDGVGIEPDINVEFDSNQQIRSGDYVIDNQLLEALNDVTSRIK